ncbi:uncharacterized protein J3D65DRAFT_656926 [Phyllosticta citribraziliensis]|uniref:Uncharacterized protein n=1 Tax=Phyllosticta citribraziliensis TaxID=989973 RepID=A0ABR1LVV1_9PEZI
MSRFDPAVLNPIKFDEEVEIFFCPGTRRFRVHKDEKTGKEVWYQKCGTVKPTSCFYMNPFSTERLHGPNVFFANGKILSDPFGFLTFRTDQDRAKARKVFGSYWDIIFVEGEDQISSRGNSTTPDIPVDPTTLDAFSPLGSSGQPSKPMGVFETSAKREMLSPDSDGPRPRKILRAYDTPESTASTLEEASAITPTSTDSIDANSFNLPSEALTASYSTNLNSSAFVDAPIQEKPNETPSAEVSMSGGIELKLKNDSQSHFSSVRSFPKLLLSSDAAGDRKEKGFEKDAFNTFNEVHVPPVSSLPKLSPFPDAAGDRNQKGSEKDGFDNFKPNTVFKGNLTTAAEVDAMMKWLKEASEPGWIERERQKRQ